MYKYVVGCFYTENTPYAKEAKELEQTCRNFNIHCHLKGYQSRCSWVRNAAIKPEFIAHMLEIHPFSDLLYLDADARIRRYPEYFDNFEGDVGVHFRRGWELLSGTIYLKNNERVRELVRKWALQQLEYPDEWDQKVFQEVLLKQTDITVVDLPPQYCQIFDSMKKHGQPVIEHLQASRRYKKLVELGVCEEHMEIPSKLGKVRVRRATDGTLYIARRDRVAEAFLDEHATRLPNQLRWIPRFASEVKLLDHSKTFKGKTCYIVGKGPSLDELTVEDFTDPIAPVIALNEAIFKVEELGLPNPVFGLQQDAKLKDSCLPKQGSPIFVGNNSANYYSDYSEAIVFNNLRLGLPLNALSVSAAITIAKRLGTSDFKLLCFDACVNGSLEYAQCIPKDVTWGGEPTRFKDHRKRIEHRLGDSRVEWIIPKKKSYYRKIEDKQEDIQSAHDTNLSNPAEEVYDIPQPLPHNPALHHEPSQEEH